ncbi:Uncharacterised protein [Serratia rubidaea]|nr:Uncharacterised protein [Serratia rubidaea]
MAGDIVRINFQATVYVVTDTLIARTAIQLRAYPRNIGDKLRRTIGHALGIRDAELLRNILRGVKHPRPVDRLAEVNHPPAVQRIDSRGAHIGGGSFQHVGNLRCRQIRETLQQYGDRTGHVRRCHRGTVFIAVVRRQLLRIGAVGHRAVYFTARRSNAEAGGVAATG